MIDETGARRQESMRVSPSQRKIHEFPFPLKGIIDAVYYYDSDDNKTQQTVVDIDLMNGYTSLKKVPLCTAKINQKNGEEWTPDPGDGVIVQFINGEYCDPIVTGYFRLPDNEVQASKTDAPTGKRRYHLKCNKTDVVIDKDGNRTTHIEGNETVTIKNNESVTVQTGDITVDVVQGKCTVHIKGKTAWQSEGTIDFDGTNTGAVKGVVQGDNICAYTGKPHAHISATVKASK